MPTVRFTENIQRHVVCPTSEVTGETVADVLDAYFDAHTRARAYVLDEHGGLRPHMVVFVDGRQVVDRETLGDHVEATSTIDVMQALSGG